MRAKRRRRLAQVQPEMSPEREEQITKRAFAINAAQQGNLRNSSWLGDFEPMLPTCPLTGRKIPPASVANFAALVWRCDGFGFAWECLEHTDVLDNMDRVGQELGQVVV